MSMSIYTQTHMYTLDIYVYTGREYSRHDTYMRDTRYITHILESVDS